LKSINFQSLDNVDSFDDVSLFTKVPVNEVLRVISSKLRKNYILVEWSALQPEAIMELLEVCLRTTYFQLDDKFFQQKDGIAIGSFLSPIMTFTWSILRIWLSTQHYIYHRCGSDT
jgi:hypothetical protein